SEAGREVDVGATRYKRKYNEIEMEERKGINLDRAVVQADKSGDKAMYGSGVTRREILDGKIAVPEVGAEPARGTCQILGSPLKSPSGTESPFWGTLGETNHERGNCDNSHSSATGSTIDQHTPLPVG
ncbi:MAG: hypothetical protein M3R43_06430, partial [Acidobacteriota bacterium]|nr:hypothetical protein [Acidobacteriota bacterium]